MLTINGVRLHYRLEIKFWGSTFDKHNVNNLAVRCKSSLSPIRYHMTWGADREVFLHMYTTVVLLKMDYG